MGSKIIKIAMLTLALGMAIVNGAQAQEIGEDEISFDVLKWFYSHYENAEIPIWEIVKSETNVELYKVSFEHKGKQLAAIYTKAGKRAYEDMIYAKGESPEQLLDYVSTNYDKYKILAIHKHTNYVYGERMQTDTNYELVIKTGKDIASVWFGQSMSRHSSFDSSNLALK